MKKYKITIYLKKNVFYFNNIERKISIFQTIYELFMKMLNVSIKIE